MKSKVGDEKYLGYCMFCGKPTEASHHLVFGNQMRNLADQDGLKVDICNKCHNMGKLTERIHDNVMAEKLSKCFGQAIFERNYIAEKGGTIEDAREAFRRRYGRCYY